MEVKNYAEANRLLTEGIGMVEEHEHDGLVGAEDRAAGERRQERVRNLAGAAGDDDADGSLRHGGELFAVERATDKVSERISRFGVGGVCDEAL